MYKWLDTDIVFAVRISYMVVLFLSVTKGVKNLLCEKWVWGTKVKYFFFGNYLSIMSFYIK